MRNTTVSKFDFTIDEIELQEAELAKKEDWHRRLHLEPEPIPVYYCGSFRFEFEPDDYGQEARL